jgi:hypothetical protein
VSLEESHRVRERPGDAPELSTRTVGSSGAASLRPSALGTRASPAMRHVACRPARNARPRATPPSTSRLTSRRRNSAASHGSPMSAPTLIVLAITNAATTGYSSVSRVLLNVVVQRTGGTSAPNAGLSRPDVRLFSSKAALRHQPPA